ncbi:MAG: 50S ribosomal protein L10 [Pseudomonadota bacterium]
MTLRLEGKKAIVAEVAEMAKKATAVVAAEYNGLTVKQLTALRKSAREAGVEMRVVRNTLASRAFEGTNFACMQSALVGPLLLAFSQVEPSAAARLIRDFAKTNEKLLVKALSVDGKLLPASDLAALASLPTRNEAIAQLMSVMLGPITKLVRTLAEPHGKLVRTVAAIRDQKQQAA